MKLKKFFIILCLFVLPITVNAKNDDFINHFGVKISSEQFNKLKSMGYDTRLINALEPEQFEQLINSEVIAEESKCYKISTKYDKFGNIIDKKEIEISESDFEKFDPIVEKYSIKENNGSWETTYKKIEAKVNKESSGRYLHNFYVTWKKNPKNNYVDFIAHRYTGTLPIGNYYTELIYEKDGISHESPCSFSHDCTRITNIDDGWIGAFQLPSQYEKLYAYSSFSLLNNTQTIKVYSTYQHAQKKTTLGNVLNTAKADPKGLGGVVTLGNVVNTYFDQMQGISITI